MGISADDLDLAPEPAPGAADPPQAAARPAEAYAAAEPERPEMITHRGTMLTTTIFSHRGQVVSYEVGQVVEVDDGQRAALDRSDAAAVLWDGSPPPTTETLLVALRAGGTQKRLHGKD